MTRRRPLVWRPRKTARLRSWAAALLLGAVASSAGAAQPIETRAGRWLAVADLGAPARARFFDLRRRAAPICPDAPLWSLGDPPFSVAPAAPSYERGRAIRENVQKEFAAAPGDYVFVADPLGMPFGAAGARRGDRLVEVDDRRWNALVAFLAETRASAAARAQAASDPSSARAAPAPRRTVREIEREISDELAADPARRFTLRRGEQEIPITVAAVRTCAVGFDAVDSTYLYAEALGNAVYVTVPLIESLGEDELTMVLAHELSQVLLKNQRNDVSFPWGGKLGTPLGTLLQIAQNRELGAYPLADASLIDGDRLTLWLLRTYGIAPAAYLQFLEKMQGEESVVVDATYARTRPLTAKRAAALREEIDQFARTGTLRAPSRFTVARLQDLAAPGASTAARPAMAKEEFDRMPLRTKGQERLQHYLTLPSPKAFFVFEDSSWRFWSATTRPVDKGFEYCSQQQKKCWLYAVDEEIVWRPEGAGRIGSASDWERARADMKAAKP